MIRRDAALQRMISPELPTILFVAVASCTGFWVGLGTAVLTVVAVVVTRVRRALPLRAVLGATIGLGIAAIVVHQTGAAASGLLPDIWLDLVLAVVLAGSIAVRRPLFGVLWSIVRREPLLRRADPATRRGYFLTTGIAAVALAGRSLALAVVYLNDEPVAWLLVVKIVIGLPVTVIVVAAAYAAGGLSDHNRPTYAPADHVSEGA